jgi:hypothetical protein
MLPPPFAGRGVDLHRFVSRVFGIAGHGGRAAERRLDGFRMAASASVERYCFLSVPVRVFNASKENEK